jgi:cell division septal protein FtsQ
VSKNTKGEEIQTKLEQYLGNNLLFFDTDKVYELLADESYIEVLSVDKRFPNVLFVELKERREIFYVRNGEKTFATTSDGFVLRELSESERIGELPRDRILLEFSEVDLLDLTVGKCFTAENKDLVQVVFDMAKSVNFTDCIKSIEVKKIAEILGVGEYDAVFATYTGVKMTVEDFLFSGVEKAVNAFYVYDSVLTDFQKADGEIQSFVMKNGAFSVTYNQQDVWTSGN